MSKTDIWDSLCKTDPTHTKAFSRAGGFKGTAIKPIWIVRKLTEQFGPVGIGWGMGEPSFQVIPCDGETLVYCTVTCWHTTKDHTFVGVGGDKVTTKRQSGPFNDDEAFKKAFTDAVGNAFKFVGIGADVHMGLFDDSKYVSEVREAFEAVNQPTKISHEQWTELELLIPAAKLIPAQFNQTFGCKSVKDLPASKFDEAKSRLNDRLAALAKQETNEKVNENA